MVSVKLVCRDASSCYPLTHGASVWFHTELVGAEAAVGFAVRAGVNRGDVHNFKVPQGRKHLPVSGLAPCASHAAGIVLTCHSADNLEQQHGEQLFSGRHCAM